MCCSVAVKRMEKENDRVAFVRHQSGRREELEMSLLAPCTFEVIAKVRNLPFDRLRVNGLRLKSLTFSVRGELVEPQKNTFAIGSIN